MDDVCGLDSDVSDVGGRQGGMGVLWCSVRL